ncbi:MAG: hypothetical protein ABW167_09715 [Baekduia sp.]
MNGARRVAILVCSLLAAPGILVIGADVADAAKPKAKAKACKKGTTKIRLGKGRTGCVKLRVKAPPVRAVDRGQLVIDRVLSPAWPKLRDRRGRTLPSTASVLRRIGHGASTKLRAQLKKGLALVAAKATRARASQRARAADSLGGISNGTELGFNAEVDAGGYRVFAEFRSEVNNGVTGPKCPTAAGVLKLERQSSTNVIIRILDAQSRLVHSSTYIMKGTTRYTAQSEDDSKFVTLDVDDKVSTVMGGGGRGRLALNILFNVQRQARVLMKASDSYDPNADHVDPGVLVTGVSREEAEPVERDLTVKLAADADRAFSDTVAKGLARARGVEATMLGGGCAHLVFTPPSLPPPTYVKGATGNFTGAIEPDAEPGARPEGRWSIEEQRHLNVTPASAAAASPQFSFTVTDDRAERGSVRFKVTSKAGVGIGTYEVKIAPPELRYRVTGIEYTDQLTADGLPTLLGCTASTSQTNTTTLRPSGAEFDGALGPPVAPPFGNGERTGMLTGGGRLLKTASFSGCQWNDDATAKVPCHVMSAASEDIFVIVELSLPADGGPAQVTWRMTRQLVVGDVPPVISPCEAWPLQGQAIPDVVQTVPRATFTDPGSHTIAVDVPADVPGQGGGVGMVHSNAHYALTFEQLPPS